MSRCVVTVDGCCGGGSGDCNVDVGDSAVVSVADDVEARLIEVWIGFRYSLFELWLDGCVGVYKFG